MGTINPGHGIETSWFLMVASEALKDDHILRMLVASYILCNEILNGKK